MTKILTNDEMLDVIDELMPDHSAIFAAQLEAIGNQMRDLICAHTGLKAGDTHRDPSAFAGTACTFYLAHEGQTVPEIIEQMDGGEPLEVWEEVHGERVAPSDEA